MFNEAYRIEMYCSQPKGSGKPSEIFGRFGLEIKGTSSFIVARKPFNKYVKSLIRPREGDLIFVPTFNALYEIKFVDEEKDYYTLGRKAPYFYYYELDVELHKFSNDRFETGVQEIDQLARDYDYVIALTLGSGSGTYQKNETVYQGSAYANATMEAVVSKWDAQNNVVNIINIIGTLNTGNNIIGLQSGSSYTVTDYNRAQFDGEFENITDNELIQDEANNVIDTSLTNPFGSPI